MCPPLVFASGGLYVYIGKTMGKSFFENTKHALEVRRDIQRRRKSRKMLLKEQIAQDKQQQEMLQGINKICGSLFQSGDVREVVFYVREDSLNAVVQLLATDSLLYKYRVEGNMLHVYAQIV